MNNIELLRPPIKSKTRKLETVLHIVLIREMPRKLLGSYKEPFYVMDIIYVCPKNQVYILLKTMFKYGSIYSMVHLYNSIQIPSGPGDLFECIRDTLRLTSSSVIIAFNPELSLFCPISPSKLSFMFSSSVSGHNNDLK